MRGRLIFLLAVLGAGSLGLVPASAAVEVVAMNDCEFKPKFKAVDLGTTIRWNYDEGGCAGQNHRVKTYGSPPETFDSGQCSSAFSAESTCLNEPPLKQPSFSRVFDVAGDYRYYCPIHATVSSTGCSGTMCGQIVVSGERPPPTTPPPTGPPPPTTPPPTGPPKTISPSGSPSPSISPSSSVNVSPTPTSTELAKDRGGGGPGRGLVALASVAVLGAAAFLVWRTFIATR